MKLEFSAGGVVFKKVGDHIQILVAKHSQHHGWVFPKGLIGDHVENEAKEDTAVREVEEETGILAKILRPLEEVRYEYQFEDRKIEKTVYYFLMEFVSSDLSKKDHEMEDVAWISVDEVENKLTYPSDRKVWEEARKLI